MKSLAILTYSKAPQLLPDDRLIIPLLRDNSVIATPVVWNDGDVDWAAFDCLLFRSTWDYYLQADAFYEWLEKTESIGIPTINSISTVRWNMHKFYLRELQSKGINVIPTNFINRNASMNIAIEVPDSWEKVIIKPAISAGSYETVIRNRDEYASHSDHPTFALPDCDFLIQEFMPEICTDGELSFIFFDRRFSHAVRKTPKVGDFRIQVQFGGNYSAFQPSSHQLNAASAVVEAIPYPISYARVDGIWKDDVFYLMEVELIEPDLYMGYAPDAAARFVKSITNALF
jgi:glutathione synthase/RimK-type ligase-like ATP-grasp enzyme